MEEGRDERCVTVYCSSATVDSVYHEAAQALGQFIAERGWTLVYGGNYSGVMASLGDGARSADGRIVGVSPALFGDLIDQNVSRFIAADDMRHRKATMEQLGDAFVILPGGIGTMEEFFEILVGRQLKVHDKPIVLLNTNGFYDPLVAWLRTGTQAGFVRGITWEQLLVASTPDEALDLIDG
jgi:uncharacterized protein (TIGR00730 family)